MCGFLGMLTAGGDADTYVDAVTRALPCMRHRGPDEAGTWHDTDVIFGFNRLSLGVQDLDAQVQETIGRVQPEPMTADLIAAARRLAEADEPQANIARELRPGSDDFPREAAVALLTAEGLSAKEISRALERAEATVVMHINAAMRKLGARNRVHAVTLATRLGII